MLCVMSCNIIHFLATNMPPEIRLMNNVLCSLQKNEYEEVYYL